MRMNEITFASREPIDGYGPGGFRIGGDWREGSLLLLPSGVERMAGAGLVAQAIAPIVAAAGQIDVVLVGQGAEIAPLAPSLRKSMEEAGIGVEIMSTPSACRTYNVLLAEGRRVAAILIAV